MFADSDEVARAFRDDVARYSDMMSPGAGASLADVFGIRMRDGQRWWDGGENGKPRASAPSIAP
jgi:hypothetical protein